MPKRYLNQWANSRVSSPCNHNSQSVLLRHGLLYFIARGVPGILNFLAIPIYTRLLSPHDYGRYALVVAGIGLFNAVFFQWLRLSLVRFLPAYIEDPKALLSTVLAAFAAVASLAGGLGLMLVLLWPDPAWQGLIALAVPLLWFQAWFELNLELARGRLQPVRYGVMSGIKAVTALALGVALVLWGFRAYGPLVGLLASMLLVGILQMRREWVGIRPSLNRELLRELLSYGTPLTFTCALGFVVSTSDRFLIAYFLGAEATGVYAASYDLVQNSLGFLMQAVILASFPIILMDYYTNSYEAGQQSLRYSSLMVLGLGIPSTIGIALLSPNIARLILGESYSESAAPILSIVACAMLVYSILEFYYNRAFWISKSSKNILWIMICASIANITFNLLLIPSLGIVGAAYSTLLAYISASIVSACVSRKVFPLPSLTPDIYRVILASLIMAAVLWFMRWWSGWLAFLFQVLLGAGIYCIVIVALIRVRWSKISVWLREKLEGTS